MPSLPADLPEPAVSAAKATESVAFAAEKLPGSPAAASPTAASVLRPMLATVLVATTGVLPIFLVGSIGVQMRRDLGFGEAGLGQAIAVSQLLAAICSAAFGSLAERLGPTTSMRLSASLSALTMLVVARGANSLTSLSLLLIGSGVANAMSQPATNLYISRVIPQRRHGTAFAIKQSAIPAATLLGGLAVPTIALTVGWRWAFVAGAAVALLGGLATVETATSAGEQTVGRRDQPIRVLAFIGLSVGLGAFAASMLSSFTTSSFHEAGFSEGVAGWMAAAGSALVICTRLILGNRSDRVHGPRFSLVAMMFLVGAIGYAVMAIMTPVTLVLGGLLTFTFGWGWPGLSNLSIARVNPSGPAAATGVTQTGTYLGVAAGPLTLGWLAERFSFTAAYGAAAVAAVLAAVCLTAAARSVVTVGEHTG